MNRGQLGEDLAASYLAAHGYTIVARNFRTRYGEIDIIACKDGFVAFVEVKLRKNARFGLPREAVTHAKQQADFSGRSMAGRASGCRTAAV